jgi:hypothetical protein
MPLPFSLPNSALALKTNNPIITMKTSGPETPGGGRRLKLSLPKHILR